MYPNTTRPPQARPLPWPWDAVTCTRWSRFFLLFCQMNSHIALSEMTFVIQLWYSICSLTSPKQVERFIASATWDPNEQACHTFKKYHTHKNTCFRLTSQEEQDNLRQLRHTILWKSSWRFNTNNIHIVPIRSITLCILTSRLAISGELSPALNRTD